MKSVVSSSLLAHCQYWTLVSLASVLSSVDFSLPTWSWKSCFLRAISLLWAASRSWGRSVPPETACSALAIASRKSLYPVGVSGTTTALAASSRAVFCFRISFCLASSTAFFLTDSAMSAPAFFCSASTSCCLFLRMPMPCFCLAAASSLPIRPLWSTPGSSLSSSSMVSCLVMLREMPFSFAISLSCWAVMPSSPSAGGIFAIWAASSLACLSSACFSPSSSTSSSLVRSRPILCSLSLALSAAPARSP